MLRELARDARELERIARGDGSRRSVARVVLGTDAFRVLLLERVRQRLRRWRVPLVPHLLRVAQTALFGIEIGKDVTLGPGVWFVHSLGIVVGGDARVGARVRFFGNNTVGTVADDGYPVIEDDAWIGAGARILGPIRVGAGARVGANAVVLQDVPPGWTAVGVPARLLAPGRRSAGGTDGAALAAVPDRR
jgi:serine O-acetyltransferase